MILVYAGRRIDPDAPASARRFPLAGVDRVRRDIENVLRELRPSVVIGSAACGADLLVLEAAGRVNTGRRVVLPFSRSLFRGTSVTDRPGDWGPRFDAVIDAVAASGDVVEMSLDPKAPRTYEEANAEIFRQAETMARSTGEDCAALVLWDGAPRGDGDVTAAFLDEARRRGWPRTEIDTSAQPKSRTIPGGEE